MMGKMVKLMYNAAEVMTVARTVCAMIMLM